jgi:hypothetical protein
VNEKPAVLEDGGLVKKAKVLEVTSGTH